MTSLTSSWMISAPSTVCAHAVVARDTLATIGSSCSMVPAVGFLDHCIEGVFAVSYELHC